MYEINICGNTYAWPDQVKLCFFLPVTQKIVWRTPTQYTSKMLLCVKPAATAAATAAAAAAAAAACAAAEDIKLPMDPLQMGLSVYLRGMDLLRAYMSIKLETLDGFASGKATDTLDRSISTLTETKRTTQRVPPIYFTASERQRRALLRGLIAARPQPSRSRSPVRAVQRPTSRKSSVGATPRGSGSSDSGSSGSGGSGGSSGSSGTPHAAVVYSTTVDAHTPTLARLALQLGYMVELQGNLVQLMVSTLSPPPGYVSVVACKCITRKAAGTVGSVEAETWIDSKK
jgi:hypothetical protein